jgi:oligopeptidase A
MKALGADGSASPEGNPLLHRSYQIPFRDIRASHVREGVAAILSRAQVDIDALADAQGPGTYRTTIQELDRITQEVSESLSPISHLLAVAETPDLRDAYNAVLPEITLFWSRLPLNEKLWNRVKAFAETPQAEALVGIHARHLEKTLRDFKRAGADLPPDRKARLEDVRLDLARLQRKFSENVLDATAAFEMLITDEGRLDGIPVGPLARFRAAATEKDQSGWLLTLDFPSYEPVMKYCRDRSLREELLRAYVGRCRGDDHDNVPLLPTILSLRQELAEILGHRHFPDYRLQEAMAKSGDSAMAFEEELTTRTRAFWERDLSQLRDHAADLGLPDLQPWDAGFVAESLRKDLYDIDDELLRPHFPLEGVLAGLFALVGQVFDLVVVEAENPQVWHPDVRFYRVMDKEGTWLGSFYTDWFPRKEKRQGAWMHDFITGGPRDISPFQPHLGFIAGNFSPPEGDSSALLTHREVQTVFHEFGHLLHHLTSKVPVPGRAGLNVAWDWVELPSQLMENWTWEEEGLALFAKHFETGAPLPKDVLQRMMAARRFLGGWYQMRQLSFGTLDLALHGSLAPALPDSEDPNVDLGSQVLAFCEEQLLPFSPSPSFARSHILTTFTHLFSGGYAAGYYSYLWSEVLDADVFTRFQAEGVLNPNTGRAYLEAILSRGDSAEPEDLFREFMGRDPDPEALFRRNLGPLPAQE